MLCMALILQLPLLKRIINENYSQSYSAFQNTWMYQLVGVKNEFGIIVLLLAVIGLIYSIVKKEHRKNGISCFLNIIICYFLFTRVQTMGVHHFLAISLWMILLVGYGIYGIYSILKYKWMKVIWLIFVVGLFVINFSTTYIFRNISIPI